MEDTALSKPKVLVVGSGGVGAIAAYSLHLNNRCEVTLVVRSEYNHVLEHGFHIKSVTYGEVMNWKPHNLAKSVKDAYDQFGEFDYIVVTTKNIPDGPTPCEDIIRPAVSKKSTIVLIQNGFGIEVPMIEQFPGNVILSGVSLIGSTNINSVVTNSHKDQVSVGIFEGQKVASEVSEAKMYEFISLYKNDDPKINTVTVDNNVKQTRWQKLIYNSVLNTTTAITNVDVNRVQMAIPNADLIEPAMNELTKIAASDGITLHEDIREKFIHIGDGLFYSPSMCIDQRKNQLMELEIILGNPLKIAKKNNVSCPILHTLYCLLRVIQLRIMETNGIIKINEEDFKCNSNDYPEILKRKSSLNI